MTQPESPDQRFAGERGDFAIFIAVMMTAVLLLGGIAYDGPRLIAARQHAAHLAAETANVAAATIAAGGTLAQAREAARLRLAKELPRDGQSVDLVDLACVANRVEVAVLTIYESRSALAVFRDRHTVFARGAAETVLVGPDGVPAPIGYGYLPECPLFAGSP